MTPSQQDAYLRQRALRVVTDTEGDYTMLTRTLAIGVLDLLDKRNRAVEMTSEHWHAEMAELRDGLASVSEIVGCNATLLHQDRETWRPMLTALDQAMRERALDIDMLAARCEGLARRLDALEGETHA